MGAVALPREIKGELQRDPSRAHPAPTAKPLPRDRRPR
jgi:hypothetical protein